jgi:hypothetical protein
LSKLRYFGRRVRERSFRLLGARGVLVSAGVFLVAVPTFFTVFPTATEWAWPWRLLTIGAWVVVAALVVYASVRQGERVEDLVGPVKARRDEQRMLTRNRVLPLLLSPEGTRLPAHYEWRNFIFDRDRRRLVASYAPVGIASSTEWRVGQGAVGAAFETNEYVLVRGQPVSDATWKLTPEQQNRYSRLKVVGAAPIRDEWGDCIGVLSAASEQDDGQLATPDGQKRHIELAVIIGRVIRDLLTDA